MKLNNKLLSEALDLYYKSVKGLPKKNKLWGWGAPHMKRYWKKIDEGLVPLLYHAQEDLHIATNRDISSQAFGFIVEDMVNLLLKNGYDLSTAAKKVCESDVCSPKVAFNYQGRLLSTDFLYRLAITNSMNSQFALDDIRTVLEIGAGLGTLARCLKILNPNLKYYIVDLPETLLFSYCFLKASFSGIKTKYILTPQDFLEITNESFIFIPAHLATQIPKLKIDLAINTYSLGEMPQDTVMSYMQLIQEQLDVKYLYSLNRYLQDIRMNSAGIVSLPLDQHWKTLKWTFIPPFTKIDRTNIIGDLVSTLEVILERIPENKRNESKYLAQGKILFEQSKKFSGVKGHNWNRLIWDSVRIAPNKENVRDYLKFLGDTQCSEYPYYLDLLKKLNGKPIAIRPESVAVFSGEKYDTQYPVTELIRKVGGLIINGSRKMLDTLDELKK